MKKRVKVVSDSTVPFEGEAPQAGDASNTLTQSPLKEQEEAPEVNEGMQLFHSVFIEENHHSRSCVYVFYICILCFGQERAMVILPNF